MKISYVLPVRNGEAAIAQTVRSLLNQEIKGEIIVINDSSTDRTSEVLQEYDNNQIKYLFTKEHKGAAYCRNLANQSATGDIIAVCDADIYYPDRCQAIIEAFSNKEKPIDVFYSAIDCVDAKNPYLQWKQDAYQWDFKSKCNISHPTVAYRKELIEKHRYHEKSTETDLFEFLLLDMQKAGAKFGGCQESTARKIEGDTIRDRTIADQLKKDMYKEYGIQI